MASLSSTSLARSKSVRAPTGSGKALNASSRASIASNATSASIATSTTAAPASPASTLATGTSNISLFLTTLRLLELDQLPDWPDITAATFAPGSRDGGGQKKRIQCVEWALFRLFELWDPEETRIKLRPFFPPLDQVQSLNLRAALLRALEQAKKAGVLGRDAAVRRTMLDECRGERLEEVLAVLAGAVLKRLVAEQQLNDPDRPHPALAQTLALENRGYAGERGQLAMLVLAHRGSLTRMLREKAEARARFKGFADLLGEKERWLTRKLEQLETAEERARKNAEDISEDVKLDVWRTVRNNWSGSERWMETLLYGDTNSFKDGVLSAPFDRVWRRVQTDRLGELEDQSGGLLAQLDGRMKAQQHRLEQLKAFRRNILGDNTPASPSKQVAAPAGHSRGIDLGFRAHENLHLDRTSSKKLPFQSKNMETGYQELIQGLETSLLSITKGTSQPLGGLRRPNKAPRAASPTRDASASGADGATLSELSDLEEERMPLHQSHMRKTSKTFPGHSIEPAARKSRTIEPDLAHSYRREPRPSRLQRPPSIETNISVIKRSVPPSASRSPDQQVITPPTISPPLASPIRRTPSPTKSKPPSPERAVSPTQEMADQILASMSAASPSPVKKARHTLSLAERTRLTMARRTSRAPTGEPALADSDDDEYDPLPLRRAPTVKVEHADPVPDGAEDEDDLLARTRRSMAGFEAARQKAKLERRKSQKKSAAAARQVSHSSMATPTSARGSYFPAVEEDYEEGNSTLLAEELMSAGQDDYEAVFKSRPRIATSPVGTPIKGARGGQ